ERTKAEGRIKALNCPHPWGSGQGGHSRDFKGECKGASAPCAWKKRSNQSKTWRRKCLVRHVHQLKVMVVALAQAVHCEGVLDAQGQAQPPAKIAVGDTTPQLEDPRKVVTEPEIHVVQEIQPLVNSGGAEDVVYIGVHRQVAQGFPGG